MEKYEEKLKILDEAFKVVGGNDKEPHYPSDGEAVLNEDFPKDRKIVSGMFDAMGKGDLSPERLNILFYIFYHMPYTKEQVEVAGILEKNGWEYERENSRWITKSKEGKAEKYFDIKTWKVIDM